MVDDRTEVIAAEPAVSDAVTGPARSRWGRPRPISFYLLLLPLVTLVPAFLYAGLVLERNNEAQREVVETLVYGTAGSIAQSVDRELSAMTTTLRVLATLPSLDRGDFETFHSRAQAALQGSHSYMILLDDRFQQLANTRVAFGDPLGSGSDPDSARTALESGAPAVSEVFFGQTSGLWVFNVAMPVVGDDGRDRILILTRDAATLSDKLTGHRVPAGWKVALLDAGGTLIASSDPAMPIGEDFFLLRDTPDERGLIEQTAGELEYLAVVQPSLHSDWRVVAWAPSEVLRAPFRRSFGLLVIGGLLIAAAALLAVVWLSRLVGGSVARLARNAERLGAGEEVELLHSPISEIETVAAALAEAARARKEAENEIRFLMRELAHRSKNQLAVIGAIAKQTAKGADTLAGFDDAFQKRLQGLARSTDLMVRESAAGIELRALVVAQIEPFRPPDPLRVTIEGPPRRLSIHGAQMLGMAVHELATNAAKYGAFSGVAGQLDIVWSAGDERLSLQWRERGVEIAAEVGPSGFGSAVIERMVGQSLDAQVERRFHADGIEWRFEIPLAILEVTSSDAADPPAG